MKEGITAKSVLTHPVFVLASFIGIIFSTAELGGGPTLLGCTLLFSLQVAFLPESFRDRRGSLSTAIGVIGGLLALSLVVTLMTLTGAIRS